MEAESALVVPVPEAEFAVGAWRRRLDHAATLGVPAHITVLYPFADPSDVGQGLLTELSALFGTIPPFDFVLAGVRWFGEEVVWLHPEPAAPFLRLMSATHRQYPDLRPYGGIHPEVVPHLTVGQHAELTELQAAATAVNAHLPIAASATQIDLMAGTGEAGSWQILESFALGG